jgi:hypothetical protein
MFLMSANAMEMKFFDELLLILVERFLSGPDFIRFWLLLTNFKSVSFKTTAWLEITGDCFSSLAAKESRKI